jgi:hypothetical protein
LDGDTSEDTIEDTVRTLVGVLDGECLGGNTSRKNYAGYTIGA